MRGCGEKLSLCSENPSQVKPSISGAQMLRRRIGTAAGGAPFPKAILWRILRPTEGFTRGKHPDIGH